MAHADLDRLHGGLYTLAQKLLAKQGAFLPFGAVSFGGGTSVALLRFA
jgi:hypothetical protein